MPARRAPWIAGLALAATVVGAAGGLAGCDRVRGGAAAPLAPALDGLGETAFEISSRVPRAQQFFRQGLLLAYGFDHGEAKRAFAEAQRLDPRCAMCAWGLGYVTGPGINRPQRDALAEAQGHAKRALDLAAAASKREQALVRALALRLGLEVPAPAQDAPPAAMCATPAPAGADPADVAYAQSLARAAFDFPDDPDIGVLHAEALLMLAPWDWWRDGQPNAGTRAAIVELQRVIARAPRHVGALHLLIHAAEQSPLPETALAAADALGALAPDAGHLVHMPAHVYQRLGRYADASQANRAAVDADARLAAQLKTQGFEPLTHTSHHWHFLWSSSALEGRGAAAIDAAEQVAALAAGHDGTFGGGNDYFIALPLFARVRFARWDEILAAGAPPAGATPYPAAVQHWARGIALARRGGTAAAAQELAALERLIEDPALDGRSLKGVDELRELLAIAAASLRGEVHVARRQWPQAIAALSTAVELEDALESEEPPPWAVSTRVALGAVQLLAGRARDAERSFRADLSRYPDNGWALYGLAQSLQRQGRRADAAQARQQFAAAWQRADLARPDARY
jgi:tetratricopeptide (TPR) repeat protein